MRFHYKKPIWQTIVAATLFVVLAIPAQANTKNAVQARQVFNKAFDLVFGQQGCSLRYDINLIGLYKTNGNIWLKGLKSKFVEGRYLAWNDGTNYFLVDNKKKTVTAHKTESDKKDKYSSNFKFSPEDYNYSIENTQKGYLITLKLKQGRKGMKLIKALVSKKDYSPINLRIKVAFFWAHIDIDNFKSGNINDAIFKFPMKQYIGYKYIDKRKEE
ncbi:MAG: hypothetical protein K6C10_01095 [Prevotella sp.]|nr:hypothetical protein [Prevotella sp.]